MVHSRIKRRNFIKRGALAGIGGLFIDLHGGPFVHAATNNINIAFTNLYTGAEGMPNCTWYCAQCLIDDKGVYIQGTPNAKDWASFAQRQGVSAFGLASTNSYVSASIYSCQSQGTTSFPQGTNPMRGDIAVFPDPVQGWANTVDGIFTGHVAYCESGLDSQGMFWISEQDWKQATNYVNNSPFTRPYPYVRFRQISLTAMQQAEPDATFIRFDQQNSTGPTVQAGMVFATTRATNVVDGNGNTMAQLGQNWNIVALGNLTNTTLGVSVLCGYPDANNGYDYPSEAQVAATSGPIGYISLSALKPCTQLQPSAPQGQTSCTWRDWTPDQNSDQTVSSGSNIVLTSWDSQLWAWWWGNWNNHGVWSCRWVHANDTSGNLQDNQGNSWSGREVGCYLREWQAF